MTILVTGGAGYIGSHCVQQLLAGGRQVVVLDNLTTGHHRFVLSPKFEVVDTRESDALKKVFAKYQISAVMHFAACSYVGESVVDPAKYYANNIDGTLKLLTAMREANVNRFIFSSTCAVYGYPQKLPLTETHPMSPVNPYGFSKRVVEEMMKDFSEAYGLNYVSLRYFNAAGADPSGKLGEMHNPETHLIPLILQSISGRHSGIKIFGTDYETPDGTCVRDYIHIHDIARAHLLSLDYLENGGLSSIFNLGTSHGHSVKEVIAACEKVTGKKVPVTLGDRRPGDPPALVADATKAKEVLGWEPKYHDLLPIIETAWAWEQQECLAKA